MNEFYKAYTSLPVGNPMREGIAPFLGVEIFRPGIEAAT